MERKKEEREGKETEHHFNQGTALEAVLSGQLHFLINHPAKAVNHRLRVISTSFPGPFHVGATL